MILAACFVIPRIKLCIPNVFFSISYKSPNGPHFLSKGFTKLFCMRLRSFAHSFATTPLRKLSLEVKPRIHMNASFQQYVSNVFSKRVLVDCLVTDSS